MSTVAIIPARGGSKGIKDKNIININGKPLIYYTLKACFDCEKIDYVVVTTDSKKIEDVALSFFPETIIVHRSKELSSDSATSESALEHAISTLILEIDFTDVIFVQATSPLTTNKNLCNMLDSLEFNDSVMFYTEDYGHFHEIHDLKRPRIPRQQRRPLIREAGNAWAFKKDGFLKNQCRLFGSIGLVKIELFRSFEIDEKDDIPLVECLLSRVEN